MDYVGRLEYEEHSQRMEDEHTRMNHRLKNLEENVRQIGALTTAVEKMAVNMGHMAEEQKEQGKRLEALEKVPLETNKQFRNAAITALVSGIVGAALATILPVL